MKLEKRVQIALPVKIINRTPEGRPVTQMACTFDISDTGARLVGIQGYSAGDIVALERGRNRAMYRVMWVGKSGSPLDRQIGVRCVEPEKMIWEVNLQELEEQYEAILTGVGDALRLADGTLPRRNGDFAFGRVIAENTNADTAEGRVTFLSYTECCVRTATSLVPKIAAQILIISDEVDIRMRGNVQRTDPARGLVLDLTDVRRGDRRKLKFLIEQPSVKKAQAK